VTSAPPSLSDIARHDVLSGLIHEYQAAAIKLRAIHTVHWRAHCDSPSQYAVSCTAACKTTIPVAWVVEPIAAASERAVLWAVLRAGVAESATGAVPGLSSRRG